MAKIILNDGTEEYLSPGDAYKKVAAGEGVFAQAVPTYSTRQMVSETAAVKPKVKRKRRTKAEMAESNDAESGD